jgi:hypothetical protein
VGTGAYRNVELELGERVDRANQSAGSVARVIGGLILGVFIGLLGLVGVFAAVMSASESVVTAIMLGILCAAFTFIGGALTWDKIQAFPWVGSASVELFENGLVYRKGDRTVTMAWDEVHKLRFQKLRVNNRGHIVESFSYRMATEDGREVWLTPWMDDVQRVGDRAVAEVSMRQLARALEKIEAGESVRFGPIEVSQEGLRKGKDLVEWQDARVSVHQGEVMVRRPFATKVWASLGTMSVPNAVVLAALTEKLAKVPERKPVVRRKR